MNWVQVYRKLMHGPLAMRPWEIERLTLTELSLALGDDMEKPATSPGAIQFKSATDREEYVAWLQGLSVEERLQMAREG